MTLEGRIALVTGGGRGIGKAIALGLAADGADVAINYRRDEDAARETIAEVESLGRKAAAYRASIDNVDEVRPLVGLEGVDQHVPQRVVGDRYRDAPQPRPHALDGGKRLLDHQKPAPPST